MTHVHNGGAVKANVPVKARVRCDGKPGFVKASCSGNIHAKGSNIAVTKALIGVAVNERWPLFPNPNGWKIKVPRMT